jgi:hypothetical protein
MKKKLRLGVLLGMSVLLSIIIVTGRLVYLELRKVMNREGSLGAIALLLAFACLVMLLTRKIGQSPPKR